LGQFVEDSGYTGVPVLFSWASGGKLSDYIYDINSALVARDDLIRSSQLLLQTNSYAIDVVAHSMGNLLTVEVMRQAKLQGIFDSGGRLRNIILASADIDVDLFKSQMSPLNPEDRRFYVLISADDKALQTSKRLAGGVSRVGDEDAADLESLGVTVIDLTEVEDSSNLNHDKFAGSPDVVRLIGGEILKGDSLHTPSSKPGVFGGVVAGLATLPNIVVNGGGSVAVLP
jgi:esterase/lipase superfamily enzyme